MSGERGRVASVGTAVLLLFAIGLPWAIADGLHAYVGDKSTPDGFFDWLWSGSNLTPPLIPCLVMIVGFVLALRGNGRWRFAGDVVLILVSVLFIVASIGEPFVPAEADGPGFLLVLFHLALYVAWLALIAAAAMDVSVARSAGAKEATAA